MKKKAFLSALSVVISFVPLVVFAQTGYPTRAIDLINTGSPGSTAELGPRTFGEKWAEFLGKPINQVNRPGGMGVTGTKVALAAKPDGYTLLSGVEGGIVVNRLGKNLGYNLDSFRFFFSYLKVAMYMVVKADSKWKNVKDFLADAKKNPKKLTVSAFGGIPQYGTAMLAKAAGVEVTYIPYKGSPEAITALLGGHVDMAATLGLSGMSGSGLIRPIGVGEEERVWDHPDIPTLKEQGYPIFLNTSFAICGPKGTPDEVVNKWADAHRKVLAKYGPELKEKLSKLDIYLVPYADGDATLKFFREREKRYEELLSVVGIAE